MECPWKDLAKCSLDALFLGQNDPPVNSYDQINFLADFSIVITKYTRWVAMHRLWVYKFEEKNSCSLVLPKGARMQHIEVEIKKTLVQSILEPLQSARISSQILSL